MNAKEKKIWVIVILAVVALIFLRSCEAPAVEVQNESRSGGGGGGGGGGVLRMMDSNVKIAKRHS